MPWVKGQAGNPLGRRVEDRKVKLMARQYTDAAISTLAKWMNSDDPRAAVMAAKELLDRAYGKPRQVVDATMTKTIINVMTADERRRKLFEALASRSESETPTVQ